MKIINDTTKRDWLSLALCIALFIAALMLFAEASPVRAMKLLDYTGATWVVQIHHKPFSFPTARLTPTIRTQLAGLTKKYCLMAFNRTTGVLTIIENDSLDVLLETVRTHVQTRLNKNIPKYDALRHKVMNGEIVAR